MSPPSIENGERFEGNEQWSYDGLMVSSLVSQFVMQLQTVCSKRDIRIVFRIPTPQRMSPVGQMVTIIRNCLKKTAPVSTISLRIAFQQVQETHPAFCADVLKSLRSDERSEIMDE